MQVTWGFKGGALQGLEVLKSSQRPPDGSPMLSEAF